jgi:thiosulfate/3-mercaptopyruvate sulfurtransferase
MKQARPAVLFSFFAVMCSAQAAVPLLMNVDALASQLGKPKLVLLHVGQKADYDAGHIPGARLLVVKDIANSDKGLTLELPEPAILREKFAALGVSDESHVVVYSGADGPFQSTTRVVFTLQHLGLADNTSLLNGGLKAWKSSGKPVSTEALPVVVGKLSARPVQNIVADAAFVKSIEQKPSFKLVDARASAFYKGLQPSSEGKSGHIPGAVSVPFSSMTDESGLVDKKQIEKAFAEAGIKPGDTVVTYCHVGQQATAVLFGARLLGNPVMMYDGSFQDWALNERGPVAK